MPTGISLSGINKGWFKKGTKPKNTFKKGVNQGYGFKKGNIPWNKGLTKETNEKVKSISDKLTGKPLSESHKESLRKNLKKVNAKYPRGQWIGKKRLDMIGNNFHKGQIPWNKGLHHSEEQKIKLKIARTRQITPKYDTTIEVKIQNFLKELGYEFFTHQYLKIEHGYQCDILIPSINLVIECDGNYWHNYPIGTDIDHIRTKELIEKGFKVLRLWEVEIKTMTKEDLNNKLLNFSTWKG